MPIVNVVVLVVMVVGLGAVFAPRILGEVAARRGTLGTATVKSAELTATMDERKRFSTRLVLDVVVGDQPPFEKTVEQVLEFMGFGTPSPGTRLQVRVLEGTNSVYIIGPLR